MTDTARATPEERALIRDEAAQVINGCLRAVMPERDSLDAEALRAQLRTMRKASAALGTANGGKETKAFREAVAEIRKRQ